MTITRKTPKEIIIIPSKASSARMKNVVLSGLNVSKSKPQMEITSETINIFSHVKIKALFLVIIN